jgi:hypothetical protein
VPLKLLKPNDMIKHDELIAMRAIAICFKPYLKPEEALIYTDLGRTQFAKKCDEYGLYKNNMGYYKREDIDRMLAGNTTSIQERMNRLNGKNVKNM